MICRDELRQLQRDLAELSVTVRYGVNEEGWIDSVFICGKGVRKEYWDSVLSAGEYMRRLRHELQVTRDYGMLPHNQGKQFKYGRWRLQ